MLKSFVRIAALLAFVAVIPIASLPGGRAATAGSAVFQVTKTTDTADGNCDTDCSLREAIIAADGVGAVSANGIASRPTVQVPAGTYTLTIPGTGENASLTGDLDITAAVKIVGDSPDTTIIDGGALDAVIDIRPSPGDLILSDITVQNGKDPEIGGIFSDGPLVMDNVHIQNNKGNGTDASGATGGVEVRYNATIKNSVISNNTATGRSTGGLYGQLGSTVIVENTTFDGNSVTGTSGTGGLSFHGAALLDQVTVQHNTSTGSTPLGGLYGDGLTTITNSQFLDNDVTHDTGVGAIVNRGVMAISDTTVDGNDATTNGVGGILSLMPDSGDSSLILRRVTVSNNSAGSGGSGGLWIETPATMGEVTIDHNSTDASESSGGMYVFGEILVTLSRVAITNNSVGDDSIAGLEASGGSHVVVEDSLIDHNQAGESGASGGALVTQGSTLELNRVGVTNNSGTGDGSTGGVTAYQSSLFLTNVTVSGNDAPGNSTGGIYVSDGIATINFTTIDNNTAGNNNGVGGLTSYGTVHISNSIVGSNPATSSCYFDTPAASEDHNIDQGHDCNFNASSDMSNTNPMLGTLGDSGGFSLTESIAPNSPAKDAAGACPPPDSDQRVFPRPQGNACDIGAFEVGSLSTTNRVWGDTLCDNSVGAEDALAGMADFVGVTLPQPVGSACPTLSQDVYVGDWFISHKWGDWDCDGVVNILDDLHILRAAANIPLTPANPCPELTDTVTIGGVSATGSTPEPTHTPATTATHPPTNAPTSTPTQAPTTTPTASPTPTSVLPSVTPTPPIGLVDLGFCWIPVIADGMVNGFLSLADCSAIGETDYTCSTIGAFPSCDTTVFGAPNYSCSVIGSFADCTTSLVGYPDYSCDAIGSFVDCTTSSINYPDYSCDIIGAFIDCTTSSSNWSDYSCSLIGNSYFC